MHRLTFEQEKELIDYFHINPSLWNTKDKDYNNRALRIEKLEFIAKQLQLTRKDVYEKYRNLRTTFFREHKRVTSSNPSIACIDGSVDNENDNGNSTSSSTATTSNDNNNGSQQSSSSSYVSRWRHYKNMSFLVNQNSNSHNVHHFNITFSKNEIIDTIVAGSSGGSGSSNNNNNNRNNGNSNNDDDDIKPLQNGHDSIDFVSMTSGNGFNNKKLQQHVNNNSANQQIITGDHQQPQQEVILINAQDAQAAINGAKSIQTIPLRNVEIIGTSAIAQRNPGATNHNISTTMAAQTISTIHPAFSVIQAPAAVTSSIVHLPTTTTLPTSANIGHLNIAAGSQAAINTAITTSVSSKHHHPQQQTIPLIGYSIINQNAANNAITVGGGAGSSSSGGAILGGKGIAGASPSFLLTSLASAVSTLSAPAVQFNRSGIISAHNRNNNNNRHSSTISSGSISPIKSISIQSIPQLSSSPSLSASPLSPPLHNVDRKCLSSTLNYYATASTSTKDHHKNVHHQQQSQHHKQNHQPNSTIRLSTNSSHFPIQNQSQEQQQHQPSQKSKSANGERSDTSISLGTNSNIVENLSLNSSLTASSNASSGFVTGGNNSSDESIMMISNNSGNNTFKSNPSSIIKSITDYDEIKQLIRSIVQDTITNNEFDDEDIAFCRSLAASLRTIDDRQKKEIVKFELQKVILKFTNPNYYQQLQQSFESKSTSSSPTLTSPPSIPSSATASTTTTTIYKTSLASAANNPSTSAPLSSSLSSNAVSTIKTAGSLQSTVNHLQNNQKHQTTTSNTLTNISSFTSNMTKMNDNDKIVDDEMDNMIKVSKSGGKNDKMDTDSNDDKDNDDSDNKMITIIDVTIDDDEDNNNNNDNDDKGNDNDGIVGDNNNNNNGDNSDNNQKINDNIINNVNKNDNNQQQQQQPKKRKRIE